MAPLAPFLGGEGLGVRGLKEAVGYSQRVSLRLGERAYRDAQNSGKAAKIDALVDACLVH
jgi:hypothetical protein